MEPLRSRALLEEVCHCAQTLERFYPYCTSIPSLRFVFGIEVLISQPARPAAVPPPPLRTHPLE